MYPDQRKIGPFVNFINIGHDPTVGIMTSGAVVAHSLLVDIVVTGIAIRICLVKDQAGVTQFAIQLFVLAFKRKPRDVM